MSLSIYPCSLRTVPVFCMLFLTGLFQASAMEAPIANSSEDPTIGACSLFDAGPNETWTHVLVLTTASDPTSGDAQSFEINITSLPAEGANYRVFKTTANGSSFFGNAQTLSVGANSATIAGVSFTRAVKIQFSSGDIGFDALSINGEAQNDCFPSTEAGTALTDCSALFADGPNTTWTHALTLTTPDSANSAAAQTVVMTISSLPQAGANYRVAKTVANGNWFNGTAQALALGANTINVGSVTFDRSVKLQFSSGDIEFSALTLNGNALSCESTPAPPPTSPSDNANAPTLDAADVVSVYGASYTSVANNFNPGWGQSGTVNSAFDPGTGNTVLEYANFNYQGTELTASNLSSMTHVHMDVWVAEGTDRQLKFTPVNNGTGTNEILVEVPLTPGSWNSVDLAKSAFTGMSWDNVFQLKFDGQFNGDGSANGDGWNVYLDNLYFWNDGSGTTTEITYVDVTFNVNMSNETVSADGVFLAGGNDFGSPGDNPMTDAGNDIWTITKQVASPYTGNYTFLNGNCGDWSCKEDISGQDCASGQYNDRILNGITENHVVNTCFGECTTDGTCPAPPSVFHAVTFSVNTDNITVGPNGMYVGGGFLGGSDAHALTDNGNNNWSTTIDLAEGTSGNWVFFNSPTHGGDWNTKENLEGLECADAANYNDRYLAPLSAPATIEYCFGECTADCPAPPTTVDVTFQVDMSQYEGTFGGVFVNGTYNNWCGSCNPMTDNGDGTWALTIPLEPGTIQYKFTLDGWTAQEEFSGGESCTAMDGGFTNRTATFDAATDLGLVCFNSCGVCTTDILGCMDSTADNYDPAATADDGSCGNVEGAWNLTYMCVGSGMASCEWWSYSAPGDRGCLEDDLFVFNGDGSFQNVMGTQTWTETWQGVSEGCNAPVAPHNGSNAATYSLANGEITLNGLGAFLGLSKVVNGAEIDNSADAASSITYALNGVDNNNLSVDIHVGSGWWRFTFTRATQGCTDSTANNYVSYVTTDDGSCSFTPGCTDDNAVNYDSAAQTDDGSCLYAVTFQVDMANYDLPAGATVFTNGAYNQWCGGCNALSDGDADGIWTGTFNLPAGDQEYKFTVNGWDAQESFNGNEACTTAPAEFVNRLTNISGPTTLPVVCWNTCEACADITNTTLGTGHTTLQGAIDAATAGNVIEVAAAGTHAESITIDKGLSINGNGSTLDVSGLGVGISIASDVDGVTISNFNVVGDASTYSGITVNPGASNVSILNNDISGMALSNPGNSSPLSYGILCWGNSDPINPPSNILIDGNEIHGVSGTAVSLGDNTESVTISNNHFHDIALVTVNGAPWSSGVVAGTANNLAISGNDMDGLAYASVLTTCTGVSLGSNQYTGGTSLMLLASLPNSILPDVQDWWSVEAAAIGYIYYFNSEAAQAATDAGLQAVGIPTTLSSSNPGCMDATACNYDADALTDDGSCTYPAHPNFDCNGDCLNDADGDGICDELEGLIPELETACGQGTVWDATLGQCIMDVQCIGDVDLDGHIGSTDLLYLLGNFGTYCTGNPE